MTIALLGMKVKGVKMRSTFPYCNSWVMCCHQLTIVTYVVSGAWVGMTSFCAVPIILFLMLRSICLNEIQLRDYWYLDNYCVNMSRFGQSHCQFDVIISMVIIALNRSQTYNRDERMYNTESWSRLRMLKPNFFLNRLSSCDYRYFTGNRNDYYC